MIDKVLFHCNLSGVAAIRVISCALVVSLSFGINCTVRLDMLATVVLFPALAGTALPARIDKTANSNAVANLKVSDVASDALNGSSNFMTWSHGKVVHSPVTISGMHIRVTDTAKGNLDIDIVWAWSRAPKLRHLKLTVSIESCKSNRSFSVFDRSHDSFDLCGVVVATQAGSGPVVARICETL